MTAEQHSQHFGPDAIHAPEPYWLRRGSVACLLWPLSVLFRLASALRRWWLTRVQTPWRAPVPVVVVGNITAGGAGKTPTVLALVAHLQSRGMRPGVISRGYGRTNAGTCLEVQVGGAAAQTGDEPLLIKRATGVPVFVAASRREAAQALLAQYPQTDVLVSDDGLQHYALARDVEIAVFDERGICNGWLLPAGPLREPLSRAARADLVLYNAAEPSTPLAGFVAQRALSGYLPLADWAAARATVRVEAPKATVVQPEWLPLATLAQQAKKTGGLRVAAAAGIGHPQRFFDMLAAAGVPLVQTLALADHAALPECSFDSLNSDIILITEKDAAKCLQWAHQEKLCVVGLHYAPPEAFWQRFDALLARASKPFARRE